MKRIMFYLIFIVLILITNFKISSVDINNNDFISKADDYIANKKYFKLKRMCNIKLNKNPDYYIAAYYKAYSMQRLGKANALKYYLEYIKSYPEIPNAYKAKWLEIAVDIFKKKRLNSIKSKANISKSKIDIYIQNNINEFYTKPKILNDAENIYYLTQNGELFLIKKVLKTVKKINYYKTRDFAVFDNFIIFNDSINLIKYNLRKETYDLIYTFEKDNISFISTSPSNHMGVLRHQELDNFLIKEINFNTKEIKELPDNCIAQSNDYFYLVMNYEDKFEIFNNKGDKLLTIKGKFISFGISESEIYYYMDNYLNYMNISNEEKRRIIYIPEYKNFVGFKVISYNKILFSFDQYILEYKINNNQINLTEGKLLHILKTGYIFTVNDYIYYYSLLNDSIKILFDNLNILDEMIFQDNNSTFFIIRDGKSIIINNIR